ncbi:MAG: tRNA pseudouridine(38-40) synthase TruA, partial [Candidatus Dadabacteria bacterium]
MPRLFMQLEYNGQGFCGWQIQPNQISVQGEVQKAFSTVLRREISPPVAASRTDAGVHARCQCCHIDLEEKGLDLSKLQYSLNSILRPKIAIRKLFYVPNSFHARYSPHIKTYS